MKLTITPAKLFVARGRDFVPDLREQYVKAPREGAANQWEMIRVLYDRRASSEPDLKGLGNVSACLNKDVRRREDSRAPYSRLLVTTARHLALFAVPPRVLDQRRRRSSEKMWQP